MPQPDAFNDMLVALLPRLRAYAMVLTRNPAAADDLLQDTAFRVLRARALFTEGTNFTAWVYRILRNTFISSLRSAKRTPLPMDSLPESYFSNWADQENVVLAHQVIRAMEKLRPGHRHVLELICAVGMTYDEAAEHIDCTVGTVKSRLWRARQHMELLMEGKGTAKRAPFSRGRVPANGSASSGASL